MEKLVAALLHKLGILQVNADDLYLQLISHPETSSLRAITDTLDYFGVPNVAVQIPKEALDQLPDYFIAVLENEGQSEAVLVNQKKKRIKITSQEGKSTVLPLAQFEQQWTGTIVAVEKAESDLGISQKRLNLNAVLIGLLSLSVISVTFLITSEPFTILYTFLTGFGLVVSYFIAKEGLGIKDPLAAKVCASITKNKEGCSTVINADQGKFLEKIKLADVSIVFFGALLVGLITIGFDHSVLFALSLVALPVVAASIYLQAFVLKKWCMLCLAISLVLISQFVVLQLAFTNWEFSWVYLLKGIFVVLTATFIWSVLKKFWKDSIDLKSTLVEYYAFKRNSDTFFYLLDKSDKLPVATIENAHRITFGEPQALVRIDAVTSPLCGFCQEPFQQYDSLLKRYPDDIQVNFIFSVPDDPENQASQIALRIVELYQENPNEAYEALSYWFKYKDIERWMKRYGAIDKSNSLTAQIVIAHQEWCKQNEVFYTPATIINGNLFPRDNYKITDLQFFIEDLKEREVAQMELSLDVV